MFASSLVGVSCQKIVAEPAFQSESSGARADLHVVLKFAVRRVRSLEFPLVPAVQAKAACTRHRESPEN